MSSDRFQVCLTHYLWFGRLLTATYTRSNGTYVPPYVATNPNGTQCDNFGATGNYHPNTGAYGTRPPHY